MVILLLGCSAGGGDERGGRIGSVHDGPGVAHETGYEFANETKQAKELNTSDAVMPRQRMSYEKLMPSKQGGPCHLRR